MMSMIEELFSPHSPNDFKESYFGRKPFAAPGKAGLWKNLISWEMIKHILAENHPDIWLPQFGKLPDDPVLNSGRLSADQALNGFQTGRTLLIRHSEKSHPILKEISQDFKELFKDEVDIQLYCTPPQQEGFDWHYDKEDVFAIQSSGEKEFYLREKMDSSSEIRCHLAAGDWLYIPSGYWHKAKAHNFSVHLSIGVLSNGI